MEPVTTRAIVVRETDTHLHMLLEDAPQYTHHTVSAGDIVKSDVIKLNKKHVLEGSDNLGVPDEKKKDDTRVLKGTLVLPGWTARQYGVFKESEEIRLHNLQLAEKKKV